MSVITKVRALVRRHQFIFAIGAVVAISGLMTAISLSLYASNGTLQLDLSRPGYEAVRKEIINANQGDDFATSGSINAQSLEQYQKLFDAHRKELDSFNKYDDRGLDDDSLTLSPDTTTQ